MDGIEVFKVGLSNVKKRNHVDVYFLLIENVNYYVAYKKIRPV